MTVVIIVSFVLRSTYGEFLYVDPTVTDLWISFTLNGSKQDPPPSFNTKTTTQDFLMVILALVGLGGNAVVLWLLGFQTQRNAFSIYILNLAGADFLYLSIRTIFCLQRLINNFYDVFLDIPELLLTMFFCAYIAGLSLLSAISTERCLLVLWPIWYRCHRPKHMSAVICALLWVLCLLLSILEGMHCGLLIWNIDDYMCPLFDIIICVWLLVLLVFLVGSSVTLLLRMLCGSQQIKLTRLYVTIGLTVLVFLLCGFAWGIEWFLVVFFKCDVNNFLHFKETPEVLACVNSCANPIIYFFVGSFRQKRQQRQILKLILQRALQDFPEVEESERSPGGRNSTTQEP
ncbi:mas-related G-protein coupled receptor member X2-like [Sorex fumeus]|uniref:mas-related G-protein coupled receptor member X2-like n=1 Tax=Sorex fumeus TaxID=62283 RepID=UPI0024ADE5CA|nr:mas-related G-protein coupled receptor member X2-like [Sorex fumeus]